MRIPPRNHSEVLAKLRARARELSQTDISRQAGCSVQNVCDTLAGRRPVGPALMKWLGYELAYVPRKKAKRVEAADSVIAP